MTDKNRGLTLEEVNRLTQSGCVNKSVGNQSKTIGQIIAGNVFTYFNFIFAVFAGLLILVGSYLNMTFLPVVLCNTLIGIIQEIRAKIVLDRLTVVNSPKTEVIRDYKRITVESETLVKGDLCVFKAGNQLSADAILVDGSVRMNEALVTGESEEIIKTAGDILLSGSFVVSGECKAVLTNVGLDSFASKLAIEAKAGRRKKKTEMMESLDRLVKFIGVLIIPIGVALILQSILLLKTDICTAVVSMVASLVGMIPEGLYLLASVALVVSVMRLGKSNVLVHEMNCVETLARVNTLCVDKTGTITNPDMTVESVILSSGCAESEDEVSEYIRSVAAAFDKDNATIKAIQDYYYILEKEELETIPFSSVTKYSGAVLNEKTYLFGAPEYLLLDEYDTYKAEIERIGRDGKRVILFGELENKPTGRLSVPVKPMAYIVLANEIRPTAKETFEYFKSQGVDIMVISGDNPLTASNVAKKAGIENAEKYVDASLLKTDEELSSAVDEFTVFGRVGPEQKKKIIEILKSKGRVVAMTGDGVNDVLALKCADCSVAMASGSEAAGNAAQIILLDSDFSKMPSIVSEGRRVVNNIQRSASLFLVKNIFSILLTVFALVSVRLYPLYPTQLSLLGMFTIGGPAFFLALQPSHSLIKGNFLLNVILKALPAGLTDFIVVLVVTIYGYSKGVPHEETATAATIILLTVGVAALIRVCKPWDFIRLCICVCMCTGIVLSVLFLGPVFAITRLSGTVLIYTIVTSVASIPLFYLMCRLSAKIIDFLKLHNKRFRKLIG